MKKQKEIDNLKEELNWLKSNPIYMNKDGMPDPLTILFIFFTGIIFGIILLVIYKYIKKRNLIKKINKLSKVIKNE